MEGFAEGSGGLKKGGKKSLVSSGFPKSALISIQVNDEESQEGISNSRKEREDFA